MIPSSSQNIGLPSKKPCTQQFIPALVLYTFCSELSFAYCPIPLQCSVFINKGLPSGRKCCVIATNVHM